MGKNDRKSKKCTHEITIKNTELTDKDPNIITSLGNATAAGVMLFDCYTCLQCGKTLMKLITRRLEV